MNLVTANTQQKVCPACAQAVPAHAPHCMYCGHVFGSQPAVQPPNPALSTTQLLYTPFGDDKANGYAVASLILGISSLGFFGFWPMSITCAVLAIVFGALTFGSQKRALAICGFTCGLLLFAAYAGAFFYLGGNKTQEEPERTSAPIGTRSTPNRFSDSSDRSTASDEASTTEFNNLIDNQASTPVISSGRSQAKPSTTKGSGETSTADASPVWRESERGSANGPKIDWVPKESDELTSTPAESTRPSSRKSPPKNTDSANGTPGRATFGTGG